MAHSLSPLLAVAIGDADALPFEYRQGDYADWGHLNDGAHYERHPTFWQTSPLGSVSDDTLLSVAVAEMLTNPTFGGGTAADLAFLDTAFIRAYQRNPYAGYSRGMSIGFQKAIERGVTIASVCAEQGKSEKSGAAMRATPVGLLPKLHQVLNVARLQGSLTHSGDALLAAQVAAAATHYMYYRLGPRALLGDWLNTEVGFHDWATPWRKPVGSPGMESTHAAITAIMAATSLRDLLIRCVAFTGDVDTVAAIAMGAAWGYPCLPHDLSDELFSGLEPQSGLKELMAELDTALQATYPRPAA